MRPSREARHRFERELSRTGATMPVNKGRDRKARVLDCPAINWSLDHLEAQGTVYQSVRCRFG
jgi:hypothetical protein